MDYSMAYPAIENEMCLNVNLFAAAHRRVTAWAVTVTSQMQRVAQVSRP